MLPLFSDNFKIRDIHQREIKNLLLKTDNKRNRNISNSVKATDIAVRSWITTIYFLSHTGLGSLNQVFDRLRKKICDCF